MPEGDSLHRAAQRLQALVGDRVEAESPHPRGLATGVAPRIDGRRLEAVEARGKNLLLRFEDGIVVRSHLRMSGRWQVRERDASVTGRPWLVLRGSRCQAVLWNGPVLEVDRLRPLRVGPDILAEPLDLGGIISRFRAEDAAREIGDALLDQRLVSGIGNVWKAEALWEARVSPWRRLGETTDDELRAVLEAAAGLMRTSVGGGRLRRHVYRRVGRPCPRCGEAIRSRGQGDANRAAYWCPSCES